jgi:mRNA interferase HigB
MHVLAAKHLKDAAGRFPKAAKQLAAWRSIAKDKCWRSPDDVKDTFADAEFAGDFVIFRIHQNKYRLVTTIHYPGGVNGSATDGHVWVRSFLSDKQYEDQANWEKGVL